MTLRDKAKLIIEFHLMESPDEPIILIGLPIGFPQPPDTSALTVSQCHGCDQPIHSTELKDMILEIKDDARILCKTCIIKHLDSLKS